jgi:DNA-nicking Smr family endonuclease
MTEDNIISKVGMKNRSSKGDKGGSGGLTLADFRLWRDFTRDIDSYDDHDWQELEALIAKDSPQTHIMKEPTFVPNAPEKLPKAKVKQQAVSDALPQLDARTEQRLRSGKMPVEGTLDLHGYNQEEAHRLLERFILRAHAEGKRCLLVITGKGKGAAGGAWYDIPEGVLKQKVPIWLSVPPLQNVVLRSFSAHRTHGGDGALYVYLKRQRAPQQ